MMSDLNNDESVLGCGQVGQGEVGETHEGRPLAIRQTKTKGQEGEPSCKGKKYLK